MADEKINVPITTTYDDKGAKAAIADAEKIDKLHPDVDMSASEKSVGGLKGKVGELSTALGNVAGPLATGAAAGAVAKFVGDSAAKFGELGEKVEKFSEVSGTSAETASRWVAIADDYGVSADTMAGAVGRLGKTLGNNQTALEQYGVSVAYAKDGTVDLTQTTLNVVDAYNSTTDPARKAALASAAFGKSYQDLVPLIDEGSASIKSSLEDVSKAQIFDDAKVREAKQYRLAMDDARDAIEDFQLTVGRQAIPIMTEWIGTITTATGVVSDLADALPAGTASKAVEGFRDLNPVTAAIDVFGKLRSHLGAVASDAEVAAAGLDSSGNKITASQNDVAAATAFAVEQAKNQLAADKAVEAAQTDLEDATRKYTAALLEQVDARRSAADDQLALNAANDDYAQFLQDLPAKLKDTKGDQEAINALYRDGVEHVRDIADATTKLNDEQAAANGTTVTATQKLDAWNREMLYGAMTATPALRDQILGYIADANAIPAEKLTDIKALIAQGKFDEAAAALADLSKPRTATVTADAQTAQAESELQRLIRDRNVKIQAEIIAKGGSGFFGRGSEVGGTAAPAAPVVVNVNMPAGSKGVDVVRQVAGQTRRNGRRYGTQQVVNFARR